MLVSSCGFSEIGRPANCEALFQFRKQNTEFWEVHTRDDRLKTTQLQQVVWLKS